MSRPAERALREDLSPDRYDVDRVARYLQRNLGVERFLRDQGLRVAAIDRTARLVERCVMRQERVHGTGAGGDRLSGCVPRGMKKV